MCTCGRLSPKAGSLWESHWWPIRSSSAEQVGSDNYCCANCKLQIRSNFSYISQLYPDKLFSYSVAVGLYTNELSQIIFTPWPQFSWYLRQWWGWRGRRWSQKPQRRDQSAKLLTLCSQPLGDRRAPDDSFHHWRGFLLVSSILATCMETHMALQKLTTMKVIIVSHCSFVKDAMMARSQSETKKGFPISFCFVI